jgi:hypothetical protein
VDVRTAAPTAASGLQFELHQTALLAGDAAPVDQLPWKATQTDQLAERFVVSGKGGVVWAAIGGGKLRAVNGPDGAVFGLRAVYRGFTPRLALVALVDGVLVNGARAPRLAVLAPRDTVVLFGVEPALMLYVTERFRPFVGAATEDTGLLGQECPACAIEIQSEPATHVATCRCGAVYHHETEETHPGLPPDERLDCLTKAGFCLRCKEKLTTEEKLVWDPATL